MKTHGNYLRSWKMWVFALGGIVLNLGLSFFCHACHIPLFLNVIGTVLTGALCGEIPALAVALITNLAFMGVDRYAVFYAGLTSLIGFLSSVFSRRGLLSRWKAFPFVYGAFVLIDAVGVTLLAYYINGRSFGDAISAPLAEFFVNKGFAVLPSLLLADFLIGLADKALVLPFCYVFLRHLPPALASSLPLGALYARREDQPKTHSLPAAFSIRDKVMAMTLATNLIIGVSFSVSFFLIVRQKGLENYSSQANSYAQLAADMADGSFFPDYLASPSAPEESYGEMKGDLDRVVRASNGGILNLGIYVADEDDLTVIYDSSGAYALGEEEAWSAGLAGGKAALLAGETPFPIAGSAEGHSVLWAFAPIYFPSGKAFAAVTLDLAPLDIEVESSLAKAVAITLIILLFGEAISHYFAEKHIIDPLLAIDRQMTTFQAIGPEKWLSSPEWQERPLIKTGDELEAIASRMSETEEQIALSYGKALAQSREITGMQESIIAVFADLVESRDKMTGDHVKRATFYVGEVTKELFKDSSYKPFLTPNYRKALLVAAPLHDIGKIVISDAILNKPGKLSAEETAIMRTHTTEGKRIIEKAMKGTLRKDYLSLAAELAYTHHEWWDGTGYPQGLKGEAIPLSGRIMAVADVFDALVSKRPYKEAIPFAEAMKIIASESGTHFDPKVAAAFLACREEIRRFLRE